MTVQCPVCSGTQIALFLQREQVPVHQHLVFKNRRAARDMARGQLDMAVCQDCGFVFNRAFDFSLLAYDESYDNTQSCSTFFNDYLDELVAYLVEERQVRDCLVVEVGCGKGAFLRKLVAYPGANNRGIGFDPSYVGPDTELEGRLTFRRHYYDAASAGLGADVVICRHVIEHVPEPLDLLRSVRAALGAEGQARVYFETPCVDWILRNQVIWDFFYEHCSLFNEASFGLAFARAGFEVEAVRHVFGGQYLWLEARPGAAAHSAIPAEAGARTAALAADYGAQERRLREGWLARLHDLARTGGLALWGAGAKGVTFANLVDPQAQLFDCIVDLNPNKQQGFLPGSGHPLVAPAELPQRDVRYAILMNPNYREENERWLQDQGIAVTLLDLDAL